MLLQTYECVLPVLKKVSKSCQILLFVHKEATLAKNCVAFLYALTAAQKKRAAQKDRAKKTVKKKKQEDTNIIVHLLKKVKSFCKIIHSLLLPIKSGLAL